MGFKKSMHHLIFLKLFLELQIYLLNHLIKKLKANIYQNTLYIVQATVLY